MAFCFRQVPSFAELFGYVFYFGGIFHGPSFFFTDYQDFISGRNFRNKEDNIVTVNTIVGISFKIKRPYLVMSLYEKVNVTYLLCSRTRTPCALAL